MVGVPSVADLAVPFFLLPIPTSLPALPAGTWTDLREGARSLQSIALYSFQKVTVVQATMGLSNTLAAMGEIRLRIQDDLAEHLTLFHIEKAWIRLCGVVSA
jgi:hypothetical protein